MALRVASTDWVWVATLVKLPPMNSRLLDRRRSSTLPFRATVLKPVVTAPLLTLRRVRALVATPLTVVNSPPT